MGREGILTRKLAPCRPNAHAKSGGREIPQHISNRPVPKAFERAIAQLPHALACTPTFPDLVERVLSILFEPEVEAENSRIAGGKRQERPFHLVRLELIEDLPSVLVPSSTEKRSIRARSESLPIVASRRTSDAFSNARAPTISVEIPVTCAISLRVGSRVSFSRSMAIA